MADPTIPVAYKVIDTPWSPSDPATSQAMLTELGQEGWTLNTVYPDRQRERTRWIFSSAPAGAGGGSAVPALFQEVIPGIGGVYVINGWSSGTGNQATTLGMGVRHNSNNITGTNQSITGPASVMYTLDNAAVAILQLDEGDTIELFNTSVSGAANAFTSVFMSLVRIEPGLIMNQP